MGNPKKYWFKRRRYGFGWTPVTWEGWLVLVVIVAGAFMAAQTLPEKPQPVETSDLFRFFGVMAALIGFAFAISRLKGPSPRWRWGKKPTDNPDEDI